MRTLLAAVGLLTRIRVRVPAAPAAVPTSAPGPTDSLPVPAAVATGAAAFPLVGALIGAMAGVVCMVIGPAEPTVAACLAVGTMALVSGGLHLDGLADTVDALLAPDPLRAEAARTDPAIGAGGAIALVVVIGTQIAALAAIVGTAPAGPWLAAWALVVAAAIGRATPVVGAIAARGLLPAGAPGFGSWFRAQVGVRDAAVAALSTVAVVVLAVVATGQAGLAIGAALGAAVGLAILVAIARRRSGLDGDGFGATIELAVAGVLVVIAVLT